jgi:hypothetical protein
MTTYRISNRTSGADLGTYNADSPEEALNAMARDAGYDDFTENCDVVGLSIGEATRDLVIVELDETPTAAEADTHARIDSYSAYWDMVVGPYRDPEGVIDEVGEGCYASVRDWLIAAETQCLDQGATCSGDDLAAYREKAAQEINVATGQVREDPPRARLILDNGGGATLQLGSWGGDFDARTASACAQSIAAWLRDQTTEGWEGTESAAVLKPTEEQIRNGGYTVVELDDLASLDGEYGGEAEAEIRAALIRFGVLAQ